MAAAEWNDDNTRIVTELFVQQVRQGNRPNTYLNSVGFDEVAKMFKVRTGLDYSKVQFKNKWDKLKVEYGIWKKLKLKETGGGWDHERNTVKQDSEWWKKAKKVSAPEFHAGAAPTTPKEKFNKVHSSVRNVIERAFGVLKMKWQILLKMPSYSIESQKMIVAGAMTLHNYIRHHDSTDLHFVRCDRDPNYVPTIPSRYKKYAIPQNASDGSTSEVSDFDMDEIRNGIATSISLGW